MGGALESVHLESWPEVIGSGDAAKKDAEVSASMSEVRRFVSLALEARAKANIKVRQPLGELKIKSETLTPEFLQIIADEVNVKNVVVDAKIDGDVALATEITSELKEEGFIRELIRLVQDTRKTLGFDISDRPALALSADNSVQKIIETYRSTLLSGASLSDISFKDIPNAEVYTVGDAHVSFDLVK